MSEDAAQASRVPAWPAEALEAVTACPVCGVRERRLLHDDLRDDSESAAPGRWTLFRCAGCGAGYLDPRPTPGSIAQAYRDYPTHGEARRAPSTSGIASVKRAIANGYRNHRFGTRLAPASALGPVLARLAPGLRKGLDLEYRFIPRPPAGGRLLDVGFGDGAFLDKARAAGWQVEGVDIDPHVVEAAARRGLDVRRGGIERYAGRSEGFDVITLSHVLEHAHDPAALLAAAHRLLRRGGTLWVDTPNLDGPGHGRYGRHWRGLEPPRHLVLFGVAALARALREAGFRDWRGIPRRDAAKPLFVESERARRGDGRLGRLPLAARWLAAVSGWSIAGSEYLTVIARKAR